MRSCSSDIQFLVTSIFVHMRVAMPPPQPRSCALGRPPWYTAGSTLLTRSARFLDLTPNKQKHLRICCLPLPSSYTHLERLSLASCYLVPRTKRGAPQDTQHLTGTLSHMTQQQQQAALLSSGVPAAELAVRSGADGAASCAGTSSCGLGFEASGGLLSQLRSSGNSSAGQAKALSLEAGASAHPCRGACWTSTGSRAIAC
jgi:hypothetical protein